MKNKKLKENSAVQTHINILQNIIDRMARNSANSKAWSITIVSAIIVLLIDKSKTNIFYVAYIPLIMFFFLDCFYLGLERHFRKLYNDFVDNLSDNNFDFSSVYKISGPKGLWEKVKMTFSSIWSFSILPFYIIFALLIYAISKIS